MKQKTWVIVIIFAAACLLPTATPLHADSAPINNKSQLPPKKPHLMIQHHRWHGVFDALPASAHPMRLLRLPVVWDGLYEKGLLEGEGRIVIDLDGLKIETPPVVYKNIRPWGAPAGPGFGTLYKTGGKRTISGQIIIEPLP